MDPTGAGDALVAALTAALLHGDEAESAPARRSPRRSYAARSAVRR